MCYFSDNLIQRVIYKSLGGYRGIREVDFNVKKRGDCDVIYFEL